MIADYHQAAARGAGDSENDMAKTKAAQVH